MATVDNCNDEEYIEDTHIFGMKMAFISSIEEKKAYSHALAYVMWRLIG